MRDDHMMNDVAQSEVEGDLGHWLVRNGVCEERVVERGKAVAAESGQGLAAVMLQLGLVTETDLARTYAALLGRPLVTAEMLAQREEPLWGDVLTSRFVRQARIIPIHDDGRVVHVVMADPQDDFTADAVSLAVGRDVCREAGKLSDIDAVLSRLYPEETADAAEENTASQEDLAEDDTDRLKDLASEAPIIRLVNQIIFRAVENRASDIHIEPDENRLVVRYRYDGVLHEADSLSPRMTAALISRVKIMARLDIAERRLPQDGRIKLAVRGHEVDFRVSTVPGLHGEIVVLRVLDRTAVRFEYAHLGLSQPVIDVFRNALEMPNGIVLVTGPTGSGKTTTLYTGLSGLNAAERNVMTVEDPIEYQLSGVNQIQTRPAIGLNFSNVLRALLRQDPDVIMVGEIRDLETAQIAVQAALTGHLVLSTLHTNSAAAAVTRLRDMGLEDYLLTAVLRGVLAQRLVRRLCMSCREAVPVMPELAGRLGLETYEQHTLWQARGCPECRHTGYRGRLAIAEYLSPSKAVTRLILSGADHVEIEAAAVEEGMETMFHAGLHAALQGETTLEEVSRAVGAES